jgi:predicted SprT family Zn-dependent metalloprotease
MKIMSLINEVKEHADDEIVDFNEIDLRQEFEKLNKLLFNNQLHAPQMIWNTRKGAHGTVKATRNRTTGEIKIVSLSMSKFYEIPYKFFKDVLAHEMIHVYWIEKGHFKEQHGRLFQQEMHRINSLGLGFNVTIKGDSSNYKISQAIVKEGKEYVFCIISSRHNSQIMLSVMSLPTYITEGRLISRIYENLTKKGKYKHIHGEFYMSTNHMLQKERIQRSFTRSISYSNITHEQYAELLKDAKPMAEFNVTQENPKAVWEGKNPPNNPKPPTSLMGMADLI